MCEVRGSLSYMRLIIINLKVSVIFGSQWPYIPPPTCFLFVCFLLTLIALRASTFGGHLVHFLLESITEFDPKAEVMEV